MDTETFQGKSMWARLVTLNKYGKWSIRLYFDTPSLEKFRELQTTGIKTTLHKDEENGYYADFGRPPFKDYKDKHGASKRINFTPPIVLQRDGLTPYVGDIGNGSDITVEMEIYSYTIPGTGGKRGKAIRIHSVRVDNLVPYVPSTNLTPKEAEDVAGINQTPPQPKF